MCPLANGDALPNHPSEMVAVDPNATSTSRSVNGHTIQRNGREQRRNPYAPRASDFLSNISNFSIIESTLRGTFSLLSQCAETHVRA